ncbi:hypothetical protein [Arthrobacter sp. NPDC058192]|uniref:hypothetical protein n=1 Tax=Arthrobacter sp. NPDC058192 TaxID=3346372 RepID=UPI0036E82EDD
MTEQLWGVGGVVVGIAATTTGNWWIEHSKFKRERTRVAGDRAREVCLKLLELIDHELAALDAFHDEHGVFPADMGHDPVDSRAREMLTEVHLNCRPRIHKSAVALVDATDAWGWRGGGIDTVQKRRHEFIELIRTRLS